MLHSPTIIINDLVFFPSCNETIGRPSKRGPEADLVTEFIQSIPTESNNNDCVTVLIEPHVSTLKPDIVIVYWDQTVADTWPESRKNLQLLDLKILQLLTLSGPLSEDQLELIFQKGQLRKSLERIRAANCAKSLDNKWLVDVKNVFAVRKIISVEAKVTASSKVMSQAYANTWFASHSYVLTPSKKYREKFVEQAQYDGIGIWSYNNHQSTCILPAKEYKLPFSYGAWLVNEMVWHRSKEVVL